MSAAAAENVSRETGAADRFLAAWKNGVEIAGTGLFGCQARSPQEATHWRQLAPKLDVMRKQLPNRSQADAVFAAAMASFFNPAEGHKLMTKVGAPEFGSLTTVLDRRRRSILAVLLINFGGW